MSRAKVIAYSLTALGAGYFAFTQIEDFKTPGMRNIEKRHTAAGGAPDHTPAVASRMGDEVDARPGGDRYNGSVENKSISSKHFDARIAEQQPSEPNAVGKKWNKTLHGNERGKTQNNN